MANLIVVTTFSPMSQAINGQAEAKVATAITINVANIISVKTRPTAFQTTGITNLVYALPVNESMQQVTLICTEAATAIVTAANAALA